MVPGAAIAFGQAITAPNWSYSHHLPPEMAIFPPKPLNINISCDFHENDMKWVEFGEKGSPRVKIPWKYALYGKLSCVVHAKHPF